MSQSENCKSACPGLYYESNQIYKVGNTDHTVLLLDSNLFLEAKSKFCALTKKVQSLKMALFLEIL